MVSYELSTFTDDNPLDAQSAKEISTLVVTSITGSNIEGYTSAQLSALASLFTPDRIQRQVIGNLLITASTDDHIIGTQMVDLGRQPIELKLLYVDPAHQGEGIGKELYRQGLEYIKQMNQKLIFGETFDNDRSTSCYVRHGWELFGTTTYQFESNQITFRQMHLIIS